MSQRREKLKEAKEEKKKTPNVNVTAYFLIQRRHASSKPERLGVLSPLARLLAGDCWNGEKERERDRSCNERMTKPTVAAIKMSRSHSYGQMVYCRRWLESDGLPACPSASLACLPPAAEKTEESSLALLDGIVQEMWSDISAPIFFLGLSV